MLSSHGSGGGKPWIKAPVHSVLAEALSWVMESYNLVTCCALGKHLWYFFFFFGCAGSLLWCTGAFSSGGSQVSLTVVHRLYRVHSQKLRHVGLVALSMWDLSSLRVCAKSCPTLCDPRDCSPPGPSIHGIFQTRIPEWVIISSSRVSYWPRDQTRISWVSCTGRRCHWGKPWFPRSLPRGQTASPALEVQLLTAGPPGKSYLLLFL